MISKLKKWIKRSFFTGCVLYLVNSFALPVGEYFYGYQEIRNPKIQQAMNTNKYLFYYKDENPNRTALKYLKLANLITMKHMYLGATPNASRDEIISDLRIGDCSEIPEFVYSNFLYLIKKTNNQNLADYVRCTLGKELNSGMGHRWLELNLNGTWVPYETTVFDHLDDKVDVMPVLGSIDKIILDSDVLYIKDYEYHKTNSFQIKSDETVKSEIDFIGAITDYRGLIWILIKEE